MGRTRERISRFHLTHAHPIITGAIIEQSKKIMHNPNSGLTYSPARARLLFALKKICPPSIGKLFFVNSGAEAIDAAIKLSRKISGKRTIVAAAKSFHGRTLAALSATGKQPTGNGSMFWSRIIRLSRSMICARLNNLLMMIPPRF